MFIFLQEHWLPHHEAQTSLNTEFSSYNFHTTSSDMFLPTEDLILKSGPTWHGTAIGWPISVNTKVVKVPVICERFCGVLYTETSGMTILAYSAYLPTSGQDDDFIETIDQLTADIQNITKNNENIALLVGLDSNNSEKSSKFPSPRLITFFTLYLTCIKISR